MFHLPPSRMNFLTAWLVQLPQCPTECRTATCLLCHQHSARLPRRMPCSKGVLLPLPQVPAGDLAKIKKNARGQRMLFPFSLMYDDICEGWHGNLKPLKFRFASLLFFSNPHLSCHARMAGISFFFFLKLNFNLHFQFLQSSYRTV